MRYLKYIFAIVIVSYLLYYYNITDNPEWFERYLAIGMWILFIPTTLRFVSKNTI